MPKPKFMTATLSAIIGLFDRGVLSERELCASLAAHEAFWSRRLGVRRLGPVGLLGTA